jgi:hypothetical protein
VEAAARAERAAPARRVPHQGLALQVPVSAAAAALVGARSGAALEVEFVIREVPPSREAALFLAALGAAVVAG